MLADRIAPAEIFVRLRKDPNMITAEVLIAFIWAFALCFSLFMLFRTVYLLNRDVVSPPRRRVTYREDD